MIRERAQPASTPGETRVRGCQESRGPTITPRGVVTGAEYGQSYPRVYLSFDTPYIKRHGTCVRDALTHPVNGKLTLRQIHIYSKALPVPIRNDNDELAMLPDSGNTFLLRKRDLEQGGRAKREQREDERTIGGEARESRAS